MKTVHGLNTWQYSADPFVETLELDGDVEMGEFKELEGAGDDTASNDAVSAEEDTASHDNDEWEGSAAGTARRVHSGENIEAAKLTQYLLVPVLELAVVLSKRCPHPLCQLSEQLSVAATNAILAALPVLFTFVSVDPCSPGRNLAAQMWN
ncbi:unnamed protein product [Gongylonema pulchrum]|uniref:Uncharacterized protein n=1 Tax=Gongylonema pulchrum TaxID=637853 RepID=A0A183DC14_9BILA|nr:unnamed protein product [Gongylonema pulchrum]